MSKTDSLARARQHLEDAYNYQEDEEFKRALYECDDAVELLEGLQQAEARSLLAEAYLLRGAILEETDRYDEAVEEYEEALRIDPAMEEAQENLAALRGTIAADIEEREETRRFAMGATQKNLATGRDTLPQQAPRLVTIATFSHPLEAHVYRGRLEAAGIPAFVADENTVAPTGSTRTSSSAPSSRFGKRMQPAPRNSSSLARAAMRLHRRTKWQSPSLSPSARAAAQPTSTTKNTRAASSSRRGSFWASRCRS